jgi:hypothetical protein
VEDVRESPIVTQKENKITDFEILELKSFEKWENVY